MFKTGLGVSSISFWCLLCIEQSLSCKCITLFFPDPWPKKKHYKRRIINKTFLDLISKKISKNGFIKVVTDWSNYSDNIEEVFSANDEFERVGDIYIFKNRCLTKFEKKNNKNCLCFCKWPECNEGLGGKTKNRR